MKITEFYKTRSDGVNLYLTLDALTDENNEIVRDENGKPLLRGYYILQNETQTLYAEAIDVENAPYTYSVTSLPISDFKEDEVNEDEELQ